MPLINCPECEKQVSSAAPSCIHCGYPLSHEHLPSNKNTDIQAFGNINFHKRTLEVDLNEGPPNIASPIQVSIDIPTNILKPSTIQILDCSDKNLKGEWILTPENHSLSLQEISEDYENASAKIIWIDSITRIIKVSDDGSKNLIDAAIHSTKTGKAKNHALAFGAAGLLTGGLTFAAAGAGLGAVVSGGQKQQIIRLTINSDLEVSAQCDSSALQYFKLRESHPEATSTAPHLYEEILIESPSKDPWYESKAMIIAAVFLFPYTLAFEVPKAKKLPKGWKVFGTLYGYFVWIIISFAVLSEI
jgi:hypothetical protein